MASPVKTLLNDRGKWEVRINDEQQQLLGTFEDTTSRDLFVEAVESIVLSGDELKAATKKNKMAA